MSLDFLNVKGETRSWDWKTARERKKEGNRERRRGTEKERRSETERERDGERMSETERETERDDDDDDNEGILQPSSWRTPVTVYYQNKKDTHFSYGKTARGSGRQLWSTLHHSHFNTTGKSNDTIDEWILTTSSCVHFSTLIPLICMRQRFSLKKENNWFLHCTVIFNAVNCNLSTVNFRSYIHSSINTPIAIICTILFCLLTYIFLFMSWFILLWP